MRKFSVILAVMACFGLVLGACGNGGGNVCDKAFDIMLGGMDSFCSGQDDDCLNCKCWNDGQKQVDDAAAGTCKDSDPGDPVDCTGDVEAGAQACVDAATACAATGNDMMEMFCQSEYRGEECATDDDCKYDLVCTALVCADSV